MTFNTIKRNCAIAIAAVTLATGISAPANADGYIANYDAYVISVQPWDVLNMRKWPASHSRKIAHIPHNGQDVWVQRCIRKNTGSDWCKVNFYGKWGWVNKRFLAKQY